MKDKASAKKMLRKALDLVERLEIVYCDDFVIAARTPGTLVVWGWRDGDATPWCHSHYPAQNQDCECEHTLALRAIAPYFQSKRRGSPGSPADHNIQ